jgi:hypothetical protein
MLPTVDGDAGTVAGEVARATCDRDRGGDDGDDDGDRVCRCQRE